MDSELKFQWVEALTDGTHLQAEGLLYKGNNDRGIPRMCCLGVLEHVCGNDTDIFNSAVTEEPPSMPSDLADKRKSPKEILQQVWKDKRWDGDNSEPYEGTLEGYLAHMNDYGATFQQIADYIDQNI